MALHSAKAFDRYIAGLKGAVISEQWEAHVAKIAGKVFALCSNDGSQIVFKVSEMSFEGLTSIAGIGQAAYFAKRQWVAVEKGAALSEAELKAYVAASYALIAGKLTRKLRAELGLELAP
ncbi:MAG: MmcQ/YjbR family DNA-binding protein [Hyphomicrobiales bacterium]|nr:MAG: MmcQ/YjbR family DNA-binding protein [Hyphomicrobiales bacterium]